MLSEYFQKLITPTTVSSMGPRPVPGRDGAGSNPPPSRADYYPHLTPGVLWASPEIG